MTRPRCCSAAVWVTPPSDLDDPLHAVVVNRHDTPSSKSRNALLSSGARAHIAEHPSAAEETGAETTLLEQCKDRTIGATHREDTQGKERKAADGKADKGGEGDEHFGKESIAGKTTAETTSHEPCNHLSIETLHHGETQGKKRKGPDGEEGEN